MQLLIIVIGYYRSYYIIQFRKTQAETISKYLVSHIACNLIIKIMVGRRKPVVFGVKKIELSL